MAATLAGQKLFSVGEVGSLTQRPVSVVNRIARLLGVFCIPDHAGIGHYAESDVSAIVAKLRELDGEHKAENEAAATEAARPRSLRELTREKKALLSKYPPKFKPDADWLRSTLDGVRLTQLDKLINAALEGKA